MSLRAAISTTLASLVVSASVAAAEPAIADGGHRRYEQIVSRVADMVSDSSVLEKVSARGLQLLNVLWEDTGRWQGSSVGPNISDVTIEVEGWRRGKEHRTYLMPVMRHDNFTDKTADVRLDRIMIPVGNHKDGGRLKAVTLRELLDVPGAYLSAPDNGKIKGGSLLARRDSHALVSAQHAFLPVPHGGKATFWPVIFNYQSSRNNPAVLTILVTRQGTSMTIIDNARDTVSGGNSWGQRLYFNKGGQKAPLIAERMQDVKASGVTANGEAAASLDDDANVLMLIQVPLKYREPERRAMEMADGLSAAPMASAGGGMKAESNRSRSDVDVAVLGHGKTEGPFTELDGLTITRDPRFPVRVTLQFYQATSRAAVSSADIKRMAKQIRKVYAKGEYVGSLVIPSELDLRRPTHWTGIGPAPATLGWNDFPGLVERAVRFGSNRVGLGIQ